MEPMNRRLLPLLLVSFAFVGCQKDVKEVRRTDPDKYGVYTGSYSAGELKPGAPSGPQLEPKPLSTPARKASRG
jgi:hypothetical protein